MKGGNPGRKAVNGQTIVQVRAIRSEYWHVETDSPTDIILSEGLYRKVYDTAIDYSVVRWRRFPRCKPRL